MDIIEAYIFLFVDSVMSALVIPVADYMVLTSMLGFGGYDHSILFPVAWLGSIVGSCINLVFGRMLRLLRREEWSLPQSERSTMMFSIARQYGVWFGLLVWVPVFGPVFALAAGIVSLRVIPFIGFMAIGNLCYFLQLLYV